MAVDAFRSSFAGAVLTPDAPGYDDARSLWNGDIDRRPAVIARCTSAEEVAAAIEFGRGDGLAIAVRGGGHNYAGHGSCDGGLMIDLQMHAVSVDAGSKRARCGGGATWADYDAATQAHGLASPGGVISRTGVGGLTLGGGIGWLSHEAGLSCDNLVSATVVTAGGDIVVASEDSHPDLFWALRGGGGNFGVVTEFEFGLREIGPLVHLGLFFWPLDRGADMLSFSRGYIDSLPAGTGTMIVGLNAPPAPFVPEEHHFMPGYILAVVGFGSADEHAELVRPIADAQPLFDFVTPIPYTELQKMLDESAPWGILAYEKALYLDDLSDDAIDVISRQLPAKSSPLTVMPIFPLGDAYAAVPDDATAWGGSRSCKWVVNISAAAPEPDVLASDRAWVRAFYDELLPFAPDRGSYVNFIAEPDDERIRASYGSKYERLSQIKAQYDPDNTFHHNANIKPAG